MSRTSSGWSSPRTFPRRWPRRPWQRSKHPRPSRSCTFSATQRRRQPPHRHQRNSQGRRARDSSRGHGMSSSSSEATPRSGARRRQVYAPSLSPYQNLKKRRGQRGESSAATNEHGAWHPLRPLYTVAAPVLAACIRGGLLLLRRLLLLYACRQPLARAQNGLLVGRRGLGVGLQHKRLNHALGSQQS